MGNRFRSPEDLVLRILFYYHLLESPQQIPRGHLPVLLRWGSMDYMFWMLKRNVADGKIRALVKGRDLYEGRSPKASPGEGR